MHRPFSMMTVRLQEDRVSFLIAIDSIHIFTQSAHVERNRFVTHWSGSKLVPETPRQRVTAKPVLVRSQAMAAAAAFDGPGSRTAAMQRATAPLTRTTTLTRCTCPRSLPNIMH